jgi:hypothetical protein
MTDGFMHMAINAAKDGQPNGIWHFGFLVPSFDPINAITPVHQGETAPGRHAESYIIDPRATGSMSFSICGRLEKRSPYPRFAGVVLRRQGTDI